VNIDEISKIFINEEFDLIQEASIYNLMYEAIEKMPDQRRRILKMAAFEEKSYAEISKELGISVNTVKTQMSRAYKFLRNELKVSQNTLSFLLLI
jgi:RNA polymerase sigma-70 factor (ECF subfamily)